MVPINWTWSATPLPQIEWQVNPSNDCLERLSAAQVSAAFAPEMTYRTRPVTVLGP